MISTREAHHLPALFAKYFPIPKIEFIVNKRDDVSGDEFTFTRVRNWKMDANSHFVFHFARMLAGSDDIDTQISRISGAGLGREARQALVGTVLGDKCLLAYSLLAYHAWQTRNNPLGGAWRKFVSGCAVMLSHLNP